MYGEDDLLAAGCGTTGKKGTLCSSMCSLVTNELKALHDCQCAGNVFYFYLTMFCLFHDKNVIADLGIFGKYL